MARNTRQQRRERRREAEATPAAEPKSAQRARARQQPVAPEAQPAKPQSERREPRERGRFVRESYGELRKVEWPGRRQVIAGTVVVIIACAIVGAYLWVADLAFQNLVENVLL